MKGLSKKRLVILLALGVLALIIWVLWQGVCFYRQEGEKAQQREEATGKGVMENIHLTSTQGGKVIWELEAQKARLMGNRIHLWGVQITYQFKPQKPLLISGREGELDRKKKLGEIWGNVQIQFESETLRVSKVYWDTQKNLVSSSLPFQVRGRYEIEGRGFVAKPSSGWIQVKKLKKAVFQ